MKRTTLCLGPGTLVYGASPGLKIFDASGITLDTDLATKDLPSSFLGKANTIQTDRLMKVAATPVGEVSQELLNLFYPWRNLAAAMGAQILDPNADTPLVIHSAAGQKTTLLNAALTKPPELALSTVETSFGQLEFTAITPGDGTSTDPLHTVGAAAYDLGAHATPLSGVAYTAQFGSLAILSTVDGFRVSVEPDLQALETDEDGVVSWALKGLKVSARCTPTQLNEQQILDALGINRGRGRSVAGAHALVITGAGGLTVTLKRAALTKGPMKWGAGELRAGELLFEANADGDGSLYDVALSTP